LNSNDRETAGLEFALTKVDGFWYNGITVELNGGVEVDEDDMTGLGVAKDRVLEEAGVAGPSKSQETPCLRQLPQTG